MDKAAPRGVPLVLVTMLLAGVGFLYVVTSAKLKPAGSGRHYLGHQYSTFSQDSDFYMEAIRKANEKKGAPVRANPHAVRMGIVSHHLLIKDLIAGYFQRLAGECRPSTIVLIGPNHRSRGRDPIAVSMLSWKTPFGIVQPELLLLQKLVHAELLKVNEDAFYDEHSIGSTVPFIRLYFPETRIVPIIIRPDADSAQVVQLADWFARNLPSDAIVIGSLDFSHYRPSAEAQREDEQTLAIIRGFRTDRWRKSYVDSRKTLLLLLRFAVRTGSTEFEIVHHTNSGILMQSEREPCTSYVNCLFRRIN